MPENVYVAKILRFVNRVLSNMYDIRVCQDSVDRQMYRLKSSGLFALGKSDTKPFVVAGMEAKEADDGNLAPG
jgi:hypothetical protein